MKDLINPEYTMLKKRKNGLYLSEEEVSILKSYNVNYDNFKSLSELINYIDNYIDDNDEIENLLDILEERNYYQNYNK